jgi:AcrR family transcriptional regulator
VRVGSLELVTAPASSSRVAPAPRSRRYRGLSEEERRADQRERLLRASIEEFSIRGYHRTSVEDIVRRARTSRSAFYCFFDNREDAMYGALQRSLRDIIDHLQKSLRNASPLDDVVEVGIRAYVESLLNDPAAARIVLLEGVGTSREVNALRSRARREVADLILEVWATYSPDAASAPYATSLAVGVFGIMFETMVHLAESGRLWDAPNHIPALVTAVQRVLTPRD